MFVKHLRSRAAKQETMPRFESTPPFEHGLPESLGILLVNLGTPDAPTPPAVRRYLAEFLADPRVVEFPRLPWWLILHGYILRTRPARSARAYKKIWTDKGSPLLLHSMEIAEKVREKISAELPVAVGVELGMTYGKPSVAAALQKLHDQHARRILVLPLYPQYSNTTTGSVFARVTKSLARRRWIPELHFINQYHDAPGYIAAVCASIRDFWNAHGRGDRLLMSFHGIPQRTLLAGDPYHCQFQKTGRLIAESLGLEDSEWALSFQSRVGREAWLRPYTDELLQQWGEGKVGRVDVVCPGFAADCLETLEEIGLQNAALYRAAGGAELRYIPALNARDDHIAFLCGLISQRIAGWPAASPGHDLANATEALADSRARALKMGAGS
jgi:ferrochelatase